MRSFLVGGVIGLVSRKALVTMTTGQTHTMTVCLFLLCLFPGRRVRKSRAVVAT